jgi:3-oxoadipate enol-lactonase
VRRIPGSTSATIPAGHLVHATEPAAFAETALSFLRPAERDLGR